MDLRKIKTEKAIKEAFLQLRSKKQVGKITVKELCQVAQINKSTFYSHYNDIYALSDAFEKEIVSNILRSISQSQEYSINNPEVFARDVCTACLNHLPLIKNVFAGYERTRLACRLETEIKELILEKYPHFLDDQKMCILLSFCIQGAHHAFLSNPTIAPEFLTSEIERIIKTLKPLYW